MYPPLKEKQIKVQGFILTTDQLSKPTKADDFNFGQRKRRKIKPLKVLRVQNIHSTVKNCEYVLPWVRPSHVFKLRLINLMEKELGLGFTRSFVTGKDFFFLKNVM